MKNVNVGDNLGEKKLVLLYANEERSFSSSDLLGLKVRLSGIFGNSVSRVIHINAKLYSLSPDQSTRSLCDLQIVIVYLHESIYATRKPQKCIIFNASSLPK